MSTKNSLPAFTIVLFLLCTVASYSQKVDELKEVFNSYVTAVKSKDFNKVYQMFAPNIQANIDAAGKSKRAKTEFLNSCLNEIPESYEVLDLDQADSVSTTLHTIYQLPELKKIGRERCRVECDQDYKLVNGFWKLAGFTFFNDPDKITRATDFSYKPNDLNDEYQTDLGGRIIKTDFLPDHTTVVIRVLDEEDVIFLPAKEELIKEGYDVNDLQPWKVVEFKGYPHKSDKQKFFAKSFNKVKTTE